MTRIPKLEEIETVSLPEPNIEELKANKDVLGHSGDWAIDDKRLAIITLAQYVLRRESTSIREDLYENVIETAIYLGTQENRPLDLAGLERTLEAKLLGIKLPSALVTRTIEALERSNRVKRTPDNGLAVTETRKVQISEQIEEQRSLADGVEKKLSDCIITEYTQLAMQVPTSTKLREALEVFYSFLLSLLREKGNFAAAVLSGSQQIGSYPIPSEILTRVSSELKDSVMRRAILSAIETLFRSGSQDLARYVLRICQNFICLRILNLDPECRRLEQDLLSRQTMLLDTSVLISLVCEGRPSHNLVRETLKFASDLNVNVVFSQQTAEEFFRVLETSNHIYGQMSGPNVPWRVLEKLDDPFIMDFSVEHKSNPSQTWEGYYLRNKEIVGVLQRNFQIEKYAIDEKRIKELPWFDDVTQKVAQCYFSMRVSLKEWEVSAHDSLHMLAVKELRKGQPKGALGPDYWFLTEDRTLRCADGEINIKGKYEDKTSVVMESDIWLEMITPFLSISPKQALPPAYSELCRSQLRPIAAGINPDILRIAQGEWLNYDWLRTEDIESILHQRFVQEYSEKIQSRRESGFDTQPLVDEFRRKIDSSVAKVFDQKMAVLRQENEQKIADLRRQSEESIGQLSDEIRLLQSAAATDRRATQFWRTVAGILGVLIIGAVLYLFFTTPAPSYQITAICVVFVVGGIILLLMAIAHEQVKAMLSLGNR
jgi:hypothetical protein